MQLLQAIAQLDPFHRSVRYGPEQLAKRELYGHVFGTEIPAYIIFHSVFGYVTLAIGFGAIFLRIPLKFIQRAGWLHPYFGMAWVFMTIWMVVTAIWCVYLKPDWDVVAFFIFSMYGAIQLGWLSIRIWKFYMNKKKDALPAAEPPSTTRSRLLLGWKIAHAFFMFYSWVMLLGAGASFPVRAFNSFSLQYEAYNSLPDNVKHPGP